MQDQQNLGILLTVIGDILVVTRGVFDNDTIGLIVVRFGAALAAAGASIVWRARRS